jgi:hypothetical protein
MPLMLPLHQGCLRVSYEPKVWYLDITHFKGGNMDKHLVFTLLTILRPLVCIISKSPVNLMCLLGNLAKNLSKLCKRFLIFSMINKCDNSLIAKLMRDGSFNGPPTCGGWLCHVKAQSHVTLHPTTSHYQHWTTYSTCTNYARRSNLCTKMTKLATLNTQPTTIKTIFAYNKTCKQEDLIKPQHTCIKHA